MAAQSVSSRIKLGILALPISALLILVSFPIEILGISEADNVRAYAEVVSSTRYAIGAFLISVGFLLIAFGYVALYACMAASRAERWAFFAMILCVVGAAAGFAHFAGTAGPEAVAAENYLEGQRAVMEEWYILSDWSFIFLTFMFAVLFPLGNLLFGVAIWRSGTLPQGTAILWFAFVLLSLAMGPLGWWVGAISYLLATIASCWIAWTVWRQPSARVGEAETQQRVR